MEQWVKQYTHGDYVQYFSGKQEAGGRDQQRWCRLTASYSYSILSVCRQTFDGTDLYNYTLDLAEHARFPFR